MLRILSQEIDKIIEEENDNDLNLFEEYNDIINIFDNNIVLLESKLKDIKMCLSVQ